MGDRVALTLQLAGEVQADLMSERVPALLIGAMAMAHHNYPRATEDVDLAVSVPFSRLSALATRFRNRGFGVILGEPDPQDPLVGGVLTLRRPGSLDLQIVNFDNSSAGGIPALVESALQTPIRLDQPAPMLVVDLPHLVAFKLYAGGRKSAADIRELLRRNPDADMARIRDLAERFRLRADFDALRGD